MISARVALLTNTVSLHTAQIITELFRKVPNLRVFISSPSAAELQRIRHAGLNVTIQRSIALPSRRVHPIGFTDSVRVALPYDTGRQLRNYRPDVVISTECGLRSLYSAVYCLRHSACTLVLWVNLSEHTEAGCGRLRTVARRWLFGRASAVLVNGQSGRRYVERMGCDPRKITSVHSYTIDANGFKCDKWAPPYSRTKRLLYVGQLIERKGILPFVENLRTFCTENPEVAVELSIAGTGPLEQRLKTLALGGQGTLRFLGAVPYSELPAIYASADIFVFPTLADEWGAVVNEAMAAGLPVLGSIYSQAVEELVKDGVTGWVFRPDHPDEGISRLMEALTASPQQLEQMGTLATRRVSTETADTAAGQMVGAIAELLRQSATSLRPA